MLCGFLPYNKASQSWKVKVLVAQSCQTLWDPMDYRPPGSSVHGDSPGKNTGVGCHSLHQGIKPTVPALQAGSLPSEPPGKPQVSHNYMCISPPLRALSAWTQLGFPRQEPSLSHLLVCPQGLEQRLEFSSHGINICGMNDYSASFTWAQGRHLNSGDRQ